MPSADRRGGGKKESKCRKQTHMKEKSHMNKRETCSLLAKNMSFH